MRTQPSESKGSIVLLSGPVGAGKTTIAPHLVSQSEEPVAYIEGDLFWSFIAKESPAIDRHRNFRTIMSSMLVAALPFARAGYVAIVDFSVPPWYLETAKRIVTKRGTQLHFVVIRPSEEVCATRAFERSEGKIIDYKPYQDLYASFNEAEKFVIENDHLDPSAVAARIWKGIVSEKFLITNEL